MKRQYFCADFYQKLAVCRVCMCVCRVLSVLSLRIIPLSYTKIRFILQKHGVNSGVSMIYNPSAIIGDRLIDRRTKRIAGRLISFAMCGRYDSTATLIEWTNGESLTRCDDRDARRPSVYTARVVPRYSISET